MDNYDVVIVGAGFSGSIIARFFAEKNMKVLLCEKRSHIAGNMYDYINEDGIRIQKYGPHTFHTNNERVYNYIKNYTELEPYTLKCFAIINGIETPSPFNFKTIDQFYSYDDANRLKEKLLNKYPNGQATVLELLNDLDNDIKDYAYFLFENDYRPYTAKQWGLDPKDIDPYVLRRVPVIFNYRDTYFNEKYEGIPNNGFTNLFEKILNHKNIDIKLNCDALKHISFLDNKALFDNKEKKIIYTGPIDELFDYKFGELPYRSLDFKFETINCKNYQNVAIVAHPKDAEYTRITEYTKLPYQNVGNKTVIAKEYSLDYNKHKDKGKEPYYPIVTEESKKIYSDYLEYSKKYFNLVLCGRLADFKYYNMDVVINRALEICDYLERNGYATI